MRQLRYSPDATSDLEQIWNFIAQNAPLNADQFIAELLAICNKITETPYLGRSRQDLSPNLRSFPHGNYLIFYAVLDDAILIVRIINGARDIKSAFDN